MDNQQDIINTCVFCGEHSYQGISSSYCEFQMNYYDYEQERNNVEVTTMHNFEDYFTFKYCPICGKRLGKE